MGREVSAFIIITTGKHAGSVLVYHHLSVPYFCLNGERATLKNKTYIGAASLKKKKTEFPTDMHAQCKLSGEKGKFCFLRAFSKNVLKRQIIIFHLASGNKMSKKLL